MRLMLSNLVYVAISCSAAALLFTFSGCGKRPSSVIPSNITVDQVLNVIDKRANMVQDLSGRAQVTVNTGGADHEAVILVNYKKPSHYRAIIKGAFGVVIAVITADEDSMTVYLPSMKGYLVTDRNSTGIMKTLVPEVSFNINHLASIITGIALPQGYPDEARISLQRLTHSIILTLQTVSDKYLYTLEGAGLVVTSVEVIKKGETSILIEYDDYVQSGKSLFPRTITISEKDRDVLLEFTSCSINRGVPESKLVFPLPPNADRLTFKPREITR
ncbi:DUF4292 domain-containing protein [Candidatus Latescibacterota bacterium]